MNNGDSPVMFVYPPEELSDESVHAISDFLHAICQSFERTYAQPLSQAPYTQEDRIISTFTCEVGDEDDPF